MSNRSKQWRAKRLILHIGAPRTGTSAVQMMLRANRKVLGKHGVLIPETLERTFLAAMAPAWPTDIQQRRIGVTGLRPVQRLRRDLSAAFRREVDEHQPETIILSAEQFFDRLDKGTVRRRLKRWLTPFAEQIDIVVYLRRQDQAIWSRHMNANRLGRQDAWVTPGRKLALYDYERRLRPWANLFGKPAMIVRAYQRDAFPSGSIQRDFLQIAGVDFGLIKNPEQQINHSLDTVRAEFTRRITDHIGQRDDPDSLRDDMNWVIDRVVGNWSAAALPVREAEAILSLYAEANARLAKQWGDSEPFFDLQLGADTGPPDTMTVEDVLQIAAGLWEVKAGQVRHLRNQVAKLKGQK